MEAERKSGTVKWFSRVKGYGFVAPDGEETEIFVHFSGIEGEGYRNLEKGQRVSFVVEQTEKGPQAVQVRDQSFEDGGTFSPTMDEHAPLGDDSYSPQADRYLEEESEDDQDEEEDADEEDEGEDADEEDEGEDADEEDEGEDADEEDEGEDADEEDEGEDADEEDEGEDADEEDEWEDADEEDEEEDEYEEDDEDEPPDLIA